MNFFGLIVLFSDVPVCCAHLILYCRLALQHEAEESSLTGGDEALVQDLSTLPTDVEPAHQKEETAVDMSLFVLSNSPAKRISLKAGCWIGYEDKVSLPLLAPSLLLLPSLSLSLSIRSSKRQKSLKSLRFQSKGNRRQWQWQPRLSSWLTEIFSSNMI
jgi:hypothetical protein